MSTEFKKGYPHGPAVLQLATNTTQQPRTVWAGTFWNGACALGISFLICLEGYSVPIVVDLF